MTGFQVGCKRFLWEVSDWYFRTLHDTGIQEMPLIRLIIRMLFNWFMLKDNPGQVLKEKLTVADLTGLINIFRSYKFTSKEDCAADDDSLLNPEILGVLFETLIAGRKLAPGRPPKLNNSIKTGSMPGTKLTVRSKTGSFYTPRELADYMINQSLTAFLSQKLACAGITGREESLRCLFKGSENSGLFTLNETALLVKAVADLKVLDPACGSGAFLIGIVQKLAQILCRLDPDNRLWKEQQMKKARADTIDQTENIFNNYPPGFSRRYYLINNSVFGVDIQPAAIDICRFRLTLSLSASDPHLMPKLNFLPKLNFIAADTLGCFDPLQVFGICDGFDIVIGNPPYIEFKKLPALEKAELEKYRSAKGKYDIYVIFMERSLEFLSVNGIFCFILPTTFMKKNFGSEIRSIISRSCRVLSIDDFADIQVFGTSTSYTGVFIFRKQTDLEPYSFTYYRYRHAGRKISISDLRQSLDQNSSGKLKELINVPNTQLYSSVWNFHSGRTNELIRKICTDAEPLSKYTESIFQGIASGKDKVFYVNEETISKFRIENGILRKLLKGRDIKSYRINWTGWYVIYPYDGNSKAFPESFLMDEFPNAYNYLKQKREMLEGRSYFDSSPKKWFELWNNRSSRKFSRLRIVTPEISQKSNFALTDIFYGNTKTYHIIPKSGHLDSAYYLLGLLNSKLIDFIYRKTATPYAGGFYAYKTQFLKDIPVKINEKSYLITYFAKIIHYLSNHKAAVSPVFFLSLLDLIVYQIYLPEEVNRLEKSITEDLNCLPEIEEDWPDEKKNEVIRNLYKELSFLEEKITSALLPSS